LIRNDDSQQSCDAWSEPFHWVGDSGRHDALSYTSYPMPLDGSAAGQGKLEIKGNVWTFPWQTKYGDKTTWFRVVNVWVKPDRIEFRQEFSTDNVKWTEMAHGVEVKTAG
jgi:hypothetical protein